MITCSFMCEYIEILMDADNAEKACQREERASEILKPSKSMPNECTGEICDSRIGKEY